MPKIMRPDDCQPARVLWFDRKKYVTVNFIVQNCRDLQVDIQENKMILSCKTEDDINIYNEIYFYDRIQIHDSRETRHDRTVHVLLRKIKENVAWPRLTKDIAKPIWLSVDFDNWRDWEHEEEEGMEEYGHYVDMLREMSKKTEIPVMDDLDDLDGFRTLGLESYYPGGFLSYLASDEPHLFSGKSQEQVWLSRVGDPWNKLSEGIRNIFTWSDV